MNIRIINRDLKALDEFLDMKLLHVAVLFGERVFISNLFPFYIELENYMFSIRSDLGARIRFQKYLSHFLNDPPDIKNMLNTHLDYLRKYMTVKHKTRELLLWYTSCKGKMRGLEGARIKYAKEQMDLINLNQLIELNSENETVIFSTSLDFPKLIPANRNFEDLEESKFLTGIIKTMDATAMLSTLVRKTSVIKEGFDTGSFDGKLLISQQPLFIIPEPENLNKDQLKYVRGEFLDSFSCLSDFFRNFKTYEKQSEKGKLSDCQKQEINRLLENSSGMQQIIDHNLYMMHQKNSMPPESQYKLYLAICSKDNLIRIYRELKILDESIELALREKVFRETDLSEPVAFLVVDFPPDWEL